jgi:dihydroflavonol-4-reductase
MSDLRPVLVTGATGFFGGNLARALAERGTRVRVLARGGRRPVALEGIDHEIVDGDIRDGAAVAEAVRGCRVVYHAAAAIVFWCADRRAYDEARRVTVDGTRIVIDAARAARVDRVLHVSTVDAIGLPPPGQVADEATDWPPGRIDNPYAATKREAEAVALAAAAAVDVVVVNPSFMIGPFDPRPSSGRLLVPLARGPIAVYPARGGNNFVDVRDVVDGAMAAVERGRRGERYILAGQNLTYRELFERAFAVLGRRPVLVGVRRPAAVVAGRVLEAAARLTGREPALTSGLARLAFENHYYSAAKAVRELALPQTPIDRALRDAFDWYASQGMS